MFSKTRSPFCVPDSLIRTHIRNMLVCTFVYKIRYVWMYCRRQATSAREFNNTRLTFCSTLSELCVGTFKHMYVRMYIRESVNMYIWYFYWHMLANTNIFMYVHMYIRIYTYIHECWETSIWRNNSRAIDTCILAASNRALWFSCFMTVQAATYLKCLKQPLLLPFT